MQQLKEKIENFYKDYTQFTPVKTEKICNVYWAGFPLNNKPPTIGRRKKEITKFKSAERYENVSVIAWLFVSGV